MSTFLLILQIVISILLILVILSQEKGVAAGGTFGGSGMVFHGRRGVDRLLLWLTVILATLFIAVSIAFIFVEKGPPIDANGATQVTPEGLKVETIPLEGDQKNAQ